jgi:hypothetical protein
MPSTGCSRRLQQRATGVILPRLERRASVARRRTSGDDDAPVSPDVLEQRQAVDGAPDDEDDDRALDEVPEGPLSPDVLEQRRVVDHDDEDEPPR